MGDRTELGTFEVEGWVRQGTVYTGLAGHVLEKKTGPQQRIEFWKWEKLTGVRFFFFSFLALSPRRTLNGFLFIKWHASRSNQWYECFITIVKHNICIRGGTKWRDWRLLSFTAHQFAIILNLLHAFMTKPISCARVYPTIWFMCGGKKRREKKSNQWHTNFTEPFSLLLWVFILFVGWVGCFSVQSLHPWSRGANLFGAISLMNN